MPYCSRSPEKTGMGESGEGVSAGATQRMNDLVDGLVDDVNSTFKRLLACRTVWYHGYAKLQDVNDRTLTSHGIRKNVELEPIRMGELRRFAEEYPDFLFEVFQARLAQTWERFLSEVARLLVDLHFQGRRRFRELGAMINVSFDFKSKEAPIQQVKGSISEKFDFEKYGRRQQIVNRSLNPENQCKDELEMIHKHILIWKLMGLAKDTCRPTRIKPSGWPSTQTDYPKGLSH